MWTPKRTKLTLRLTLALAATAVTAWAAGSPPISEGCLQVIRERQPIGMCPLKHTEVSVDVSGYVARVTVTQQFENPYPQPIEAVYTFPLSDRAAVDAMTMKIGDRTIKGLIKRREEARRIYEAARDAGKAASLLDQERPNIFTQSVANILPGAGIEITISYVELLKYEEGEYEFSFPMVVGPRYIPGQPNGQGGTTQVPDAGRITPPVTPEGTRAGHDISLTARIDAGMPLQNIKSEIHEVDIERPEDTKAVVRLKNQKEIPNRDFVLRYTTSGKAIEDAVLTHADPRGGFFTLILQPPARVAPESATPKEMMFVIDCSGSMSGFPIEKAKKTMRQCIEQMNPRDTFNLVSFSGGTGYCFSRPVPNTPDNRKKALDYLANLQGGGGTEMMTAIRAALEGQNDPERLRIVCFMTDGFIGNDMEILDAIQKNARTARVFAFGVGNGVNRFLIEGMGRSGRGASEVVSLESNADAAAQRFHERVHSPILTDISVDFGGLGVENVFPAPDAIPDLFSAQPLVLKGRYTGVGDGAITVRGQTANGPFERKIQVSFPQSAPEHDALASIWARANVDFLMTQDWKGMETGVPNPAIKEAITKLGLDYGLMTQFTSFVAVEERQVTQGGKPTTVEVPVEMTDGVSYEGVFGRPGPQPLSLGQRVGAPRKMAESSAAAPATSPSVFRAGSELADKTSTLDSVQPVRTEINGPVRPAEAEAKSPIPASPKINPALRGLQAKLTNGSYNDGAVTVKNGWVVVYIRMSDDGQESMDALKKLGVRITSHAASRKTVAAEVRIENLEAVAKLDFVTQISPWSEAK
ncbi:MAG: VWA domain-containing protein [Candidatus Hydrogenedentes bacterium]|nr:VWA domain-containing protein [Candidatus Hydrogenedentota bacterium]